MTLSRRSLFAASVFAGLAAGSAGPVRAAADAGAVLQASDFGLEPDAARDQTKAMQLAIDKAAQTGAILLLPGGLYIAGNLEISKPVAIAGAAGAARLILPNGANRIVHIARAANVMIEGLSFDGADQDVSDRRAGLIAAEGCPSLTIANCRIVNHKGNGISLNSCSGAVTSCEIAQVAETGIFALDCTGLEIAGNRIHDIGDNGIQVWQSDKREDGSIISGNRIERIAGKSGGNGPYGNGINIYKAGSVIVSGNRITDCRFSAIRNNSGSGVQIIANNCSRLEEVAIFVEFAFEGAVVSDNLIEKAGLGISITNFDHGGRLAVCANNIVRDVFGAQSNPDTQAVGIAVEADTAVTGNVVENAPRAGLWLGWSYAMRDIVATGNVVRNSGIGIAVSVAKGAKKGLIANNLISGAKEAAIMGLDHNTPATSDLSAPGARVPDQLMVSGNQVS